MKYFLDNLDSHVTALLSKLKYFKLYFKVIVSILLAECVYFNSLVVKYLVGILKKNLIVL